MPVLAWLRTRSGTASFVVADTPRCNLPCKTSVSLGLYDESPSRPSIQRRIHCAGKNFGNFAFDPQ